jgi:Uncharacterized protein conserved in bacteria (DUF2332)
VQAEIERLSAHFADGPPDFPTSALYQCLCRAVAQDRPVLELLTQRQAGQQASFLLFGAVHCLLLPCTVRATAGPFRWPW